MAHYRLVFIFVLLHALFPPSPFPITPPLDTRVDRGLAQAIQQARLGKKMTQKQLATVSWLKGKRGTAGGKEDSIFAACLRLGIGCFLPPPHSSSSSTALIALCLVALIDPALPLRVFLSFFFVPFCFTPPTATVHPQQINEKPQVVGEYESGKAIPNPQLISKLERALGVRLPRPGKKGKK